MTRLISLDHLTVLETTPPELLAIAAHAGFSHVGMRLCPVAPGEQRHPMTGNTPMFRETLAVMQDLGVAVFDIGVLKLNRTIEPTSFEPVLAAAARLGAKHALLGSDEQDESIAIDLFGQLCELGHRYSIMMNLEFTPWSGARTIAQCVGLVQAAAQPNGRVLIDTIHVDRCGGTADDIAAIPRELLAYAQVCDAQGPRPADFETMKYQARNARAFPGDGNLDLPGMIKALPADLPLSLEAPTRPIPGVMTPLERAQRGRAAIDSLLLACAS